MEVSEKTMHDLLAQLANVKITQDRMTVEMQRQILEMATMRQTIIELSSVE